MKRLALVLACCFALLAGCAVVAPHQPIEDLATLPQDAGAYSELAPDTPLFTEAIQKKAYARFLAEHFGPWERTQPRHTADEAFWGLKIFGKKQLFGENTLPRDPAWMETMQRNSCVADYPSMGRRAIAVTNTSMRVLPTARPAFYDFSRAGEGYPFDYMQNSLILAGTPLYATHTSADKAWVLVESRFAFGWVPATEIAWVNDSFIRTFRTGTYAAFIRDDAPVTDVNNAFRFMGHVGTILPIMDDGMGNNGLACLLPARTMNGSAVPVATFVPARTAMKMPFSPTPRNFARLANAMMGRQYGWGGLYEDRDCSATLMDLMAGFGIYLPRNSSQQIKEGTYASMKKMSHNEKKRFLTTYATPFLTTVRKPGHIMLYVGQRDGQPVVFHSTWGLKTRDDGKYGRKVIGSTVITTLEPGLELPDLARPEGILLETVSGMSTLPGSGSQ